MTTLTTTQRNGVAEVIAAGFNTGGTPAAFLPGTDDAEARVQIDGQDEPIRVTETGITYPAWVNGDLAYWIDVEVRLFLGEPRR
jgi:hypothetical protein